MSKKMKVNIKCPKCGIPIVAIFKEHKVQGVLQHKCSKCKRFWNVDYTSRVVLWAHGKEAATLIRRYQLDLATGISLPIAQ